MSKSGFAPGVGVIVVFVADAIGLDMVMLGKKSLFPIMFSDEVIISRVVKPSPIAEPTPSVIVEEMMQSFTPEKYNNIYYILEWLSYIPHCS